MLEGLRLKIFNDRYALKDSSGKQLESAPEEMWERVARAAAATEKTPELKKEWGEKFYGILEGFKFVPGGRILTGAGCGAAITFYNCFVIPSPEDTRGGIMNSVRIMTEIMSRGGGVGVNISSLRPRGSYVKGVNGTASGSVSFGGLYSYATGLIIQGGSRRGALMLMLNIDHPDIEEFITIKQDKTMLTNANLSVGVNDAFMEAVDKDENWNLVWNGEIKKTVRARCLWNMICESAWKSGEPGVVFLEQYNKRSNSWYFDKIICTNPCVTGDTLVYTKFGLKKIADLCKNETEVVLDKRFHKGHFSKIKAALKTGIKNVYRLETQEGYEIKLTAEHQLKTSAGFVAASELKTGDKILLLSNEGGFGAKGSLEIGRLIGWFMGDGHFNKFKKTATLSFFGEEKQELSPLFTSIVNTVLNYNSSANSCRYYKNIGIVNIAKRDEHRISSIRLGSFLQSLGINSKNKLSLPEIILEGSRETQRGFLQTLFTADGHISGTQNKGVSVRLTSVNEEFLREIQKLLLNFGIYSIIYANRREAGFREMPDSARKPKNYFCQAQHDLVISRECIKIFAEKIGFLVSKKQDKLNDAIKNYSRNLYHSKFYATFAKLTELGKEEVYDLTEPNTHSFIANGFVAHNCGEQGLPAWGVCNLGSINLSEFVSNGIINYKFLGEVVNAAVRFLDNIIEVTDYYFAENKEIQEKSRRVGLGTMGLADLLIKLKIRYGSDAALEKCEEIFKFIRDEAYNASIELAKEKGPFSHYDAEKFGKGYFISQLPVSIQEKINQYGIRNTAILTQAPTGTISILADASSGIEPVYDFAVIRKDRLGEHEVYHPLYKEYTNAHPGEKIPDYFVTAKELTPQEHVKMQGIIQKYVDSSISKTVNAPNNHTVEDVKQLYEEAYKLGCKGLTYYRDGSRSEAVLTSKIEKTAKDLPAGDEPKSVKEKPVLAPRERPAKMCGRTYKTSTGYGNLYVTINDDESGEPFEVFATIGKAGGFFAAKSEAICRMASLALRSGIGVNDVIEQLKGIRGPMPSWGERGMILSIPDAIAQVLEEHIIIPQEKLDLQFKEPPLASKKPRSIADLGDIPECPNCASILELTEGCLICRGCGYSKCS